MPGTTGSPPGTTGSPSLPAYVVDASVIVKWLLPEPGSRQADKLRGLAADGDCRLVAPDLWRVEVAHALWKQTRRAGPFGRGIGAEEVAAALAQAARLPLDCVSAETLLPAALEAALEAAITLYDALYAALAMQLQAPLVTADWRLRDRLRARWPEFGVVVLSEL